MTTPFARYNNKTRRIELDFGPFGWKFGWKPVGPTCTPDAARRLIGWLTETFDGPFEIDPDRTCQYVLPFKKD